MRHSLVIEGKQSNRTVGKIKIKTPPSKKKFENDEERNKKKSFFFFSRKKTRPVAPEIIKMTKTSYSGKYESSTTSTAVVENEHTTREDALI